MQRLVLDLKSVRPQAHALPSTSRPTAAPRSSAPWFHPLTLRRLASPLQSLGNLGPRGRTLPSSRPSSSLSVAISLPSLLDAEGVSGLTVGVATERRYHLRWAQLAKGGCSSLYIPCGCPAGPPVVSSGSREPGPSSSFNPSWCHHMTWHTAQQGFAKEM